MPNVHIVTAKQATLTIRKWLQCEFPKIPFADICRLCRKGVIRVNKKRIDQNYVLQEKDIISFPELQKYKKNIQLSNIDSKQFQNYIIFENNDFIAINKPYGIATQGGRNIKESIDKLALSYNINIKLVHRLDKDTSGILILAKNTTAAQELTKIFSTKKCCKTYYAIVKGVPKNKKGIISQPITKITGDRFGISTIDKTSGKEAITHYEVLQSTNKYSLLLLNPLTGRTHQLRLHTATIGHPIVGDKKYGAADYKRLLLHALQISFILYDKKYELTAPLDDCFYSILKAIK